MRIRTKQTKRLSFKNMARQIRASKLWGAKREW